MSNYWIRIKQVPKKLLQMKWLAIPDFIVIHWSKILVFSLVAVLLWHKDLSFQIDLNTASPIAMADTAPLASQASPLAFSLDFLTDLLPIETVSTTSLKNLAVSVAEKENLANTYSNMIFPQEQNVSAIPAAKKSAKRKKQEAYIQRFAKVAQAEMQKYGIPASIKLAQGLIESNAGDSRLSQRNNNHFGMKCFSRKCKKGHCSNFTDDSHKDFFRIYPSAWDSYRAHSLMLQGKRYRHLRQLGNDYKAWAHGLKKAGYATDKRYAEKLIHLIQSLQLDKWDGE